MRTQNDYKINKYVYFSNSPGQYDVFRQAGKLFWSYKKLKRTSHMNKLDIEKEGESVGDLVYLITGEKIFNDNDDNNIDLQEEYTPMFTHQGIVKKIHNRPIICYNFSPENSSIVSSIPLEFFINMDSKSSSSDISTTAENINQNTIKSFLGENFTDSDKKEIEVIIQMKNIIDDLISKTDNEKENFAEAYDISDNNNDNEKYIINDGEGKYFELKFNDDNLKLIDNKPPNNSNYNHYFLNRETLEELLEGMKKREIEHPHRYIEKLTTWSNDKFVEVDLTEEIYLQLENVSKIDMASGRQILEEDYSNDLINELRRLLFKKTENQFAKNTILYGPPGTGKTYSTIKYAAAIIENRRIKDIEEEIKIDGFEKIKKRYDSYKKKGLIDFITFHQSYGYEQFIEGIKPVIEEEVEEEEEGNELKYSIEPGVFREFCSKAKSLEIQTDDLSIELNDDPTVWKISLDGSGVSKVKKDCFDNNRIRIGWSNYPKNFDENESRYSGLSKRIINLLKNFELSMKDGDVVLSLYDQKHIDGIGIIKGDYKYDVKLDKFKRTREVKWIIKNKKINIYDENNSKNLVQLTLYKLKNISSDDVLKLIKENKAKNETEIIDNYKNYLFIIDEINRGNISKIFGELITLIEENKRIGKTEESRIKLPYSNKLFGVQKNIYLLGTMNTADRSIALLDTALRRRFNFEEVMPDADILKEINDDEELMIGSININEMLEKINKRIEFIYDRDHTIGHSYFIDLITEPSLEKLAEIFKYNIIPLLQEYFYDDYENIRLILNDGDENKENNFIIKEEVNSSLFNNRDIGRDNYLYRINDSAFFEEISYRKIYKKEQQS